MPTALRDAVTARSTVRSATVNHTTKDGLFSVNVNVAPRVVYRNLADNDVFRRAIEANPTTPVWNPNDPSRYYDFTDYNGFVNPIESMNLVRNKSQEKVIDWDGTLKLNLLPLFMPDAKYEQILNTQVTFADHQYNNDVNYYEPSTMNQNRRNDEKATVRVLLTTPATSALNGSAITVSTSTNTTSAQWSDIHTNIGRIPDSAAKTMISANDGIGADNLGAGDGMKEEGNIGMSSYKNDNKLIAFFGRVSYDYDSRYLFTASMRREGSSKFGKDHKWGNFPAVSVGWRISKESFMEGASSWLDDLKIRADFGVTGNQEFGSYLSLDTMGSVRIQLLQRRVG